MLIERVIADGRITTAEHDQIVAQVEGDGALDESEVRLLRELQLRLADGSVVRV